MRQGAGTTLTPSELCQKFLADLGARDLEAARALVADDFTMIFPGMQVFTDFADLLKWSAARYRTIAKSIEDIDEVALEGLFVNVYISGTLYGERPDGAAFHDIRFIDRFLVRDGVIQSQEVWNDMAERGLVPQG